MPGFDDRDLSFIGGNPFPTARTTAILPPADHKNNHGCISYKEWTLKQCLLGLVLPLEFVVRQPLQIQVLYSNEFPDNHGNQERNRNAEKHRHP